MHPNVWKQCLHQLEAEVTEQLFNVWIRPLQAIEEDGVLKLLAPNRFVVDWVRQNALPRILELVRAGDAVPSPQVQLEVGSRPAPAPLPLAETAEAAPAGSHLPLRQPMLGSAPLSGRVNPEFTFDNFVEGKSNQLGKAAARQVADNPGKAYNPLFIYGGVGLGKTHLMHAVANAMRERNPQARVAYVHSERFVGDMVRALQHNTINEFKQAYRSLDALLIDDIQFVAGKDRSQEEFFHTFNALLEGQQQVVLTCDRYPKEVTGLEERLKSRFGWGLTIAIEPPELETCVAILMSKAQQMHIDLPHEVAFSSPSGSARTCVSSRGRCAGCRPMRCSPASRSRSTLPRKRCAICSRCRKSWSPSRTSRRPWPSTTRSASPTSCRSGAVDRSRGRGRSRWRSPRSSPTTACRKSATHSAAATTRPSCMPASGFGSCAKASGA